MTFDPENIFTLYAIYSQAIEKVTKKKLHRANPPAGDTVGSFLLVPITAIKEPGFFELSRHSCFLPLPAGIS